MLILTRKTGQRITIGTGPKKAIIEFLHVREGDPVTMEIDAHENIKVGIDKIEKKTVILQKRMNG